MRYLAFSVFYMVSHMETSLQNVSAIRRTVLVANSKGGSGKSTIATNLSAAYAQLGYKTALVDMDAQLTSSRWLSARDAEFPQVTGVIATLTNGEFDDWPRNIPSDAERVVIDTGGGFAGDSLMHYIDRADDIVIPVSPSEIDIQSTSDYLTEIYAYAGFREYNKRAFLVGNRLSKKNKYYHRLGRFLKKMSSQDLILLPDSYIFLRCAEEGIGVADLKSYSRYKQAINAMAKLIFLLESRNA